MTLSSIKIRILKSLKLLGHIFDHGIDSLNTPLAGLIQAGSLGLGHSPRSVFIIMIGIAAMWLVCTICATLILMTD